MLQVHGYTFYARTLYSVITISLRRRRRPLQPSDVPEKLPDKKLTARYFP